MRRRGEYVERTFAHVYDTGGLRRMHLRGHPNILKRLIVHAGAFNLGLLMRHVFGRGTPRGLQGRRRPCFALWLTVSARPRHASNDSGAMPRRPAISGARRPLALRTRRNRLTAMISTTGC